MLSVSKPYRFFVSFFIFVVNPPCVNPKSVQPVGVQVKAAKDDVAKEKAEKEAARKRELALREQQSAGAGPSGAKLDSLISQGCNPELLSVLDMKCLNFVSDSCKYVH